MSNCSNLINTVYKSRHDNSIKCFVFPLLKQLGLGDKGKPYYENESSKFWLGHSGIYWKRNVKDYIVKPLRPDGKLEIIKESEHKIFLLEM